MTELSYDSLSSYLVADMTRNAFSASKMPEGHRLVSVGKTFRTALKPQNFNRAFLDAHGITVEQVPTTAIYVDGFTYKGQTTTENGLTSRSTQLVPVTLDVNPLTGEDPLEYARKVEAHGTKASTDYQGSVPTELWNDGYFQFGVKADGAPIKDGVTMEWDMFAICPGIFKDTNSNISVNVGGCSLSVPVNLLEADPLLRVKFDQIGYTSFFVTATLGGVTANGTYGWNYAQRAMVTEAGPEFMKQGYYRYISEFDSPIANFFLFIDKFLNDSLPDDLVAAAVGIAAIPNFFKNFVSQQALYGNAQNVITSVGGDIASKMAAPTALTTSIGTQVDTLLNVSYPITKQYKAIGLSQPSGSYMDIGPGVTIRPAYFAQNEEHSVVVKATFEQYSDFVSWVQDTVGNVQIVSMSGKPIVDYGSYTSYYTQMIASGVLQE